MRQKLLFTILCLTLTATSKSQWFSFLKGTETISIYGLSIKANQVGTGTKTFSGSGESLYPTSLLSDVVKTSGDYLTDMGTYRVDYTNYRAGTHPLFNLSYDRNSYPILDTIDMDFYRSFGIDKMLARNLALKDNPKYKQLRDVIIDSPWTTWRKKIFLFSFENDELRKQLIDTRMDFQANHTFKIDKKKVNLSTVKLKATLDTIVINNIGKGNGELFAYIHRLADENVKVIGEYYNPQFDANYIARIQYFLATIPQFNTRLDQFAFWLKDYVNSDNAAANSELVAIKLNGTFDKTKINADSISLDLATKFQLPKIQADKLAVALTLAFSRHETTTISSTFNTVYILRYFTSKNMDEIVFAPFKQNNALKSKFTE